MVLIRIRLMDQSKQNFLNKDQLETKIISRTFKQTSKNLLNKNIKFSCKIKNRMIILR